MNIGIVGAGILGRLFALACLQKGWRVTLFDKESRDSLTSCSYVAAGMLAPYSEIAEYGDTKLYHWGMHSINRWPEIIKVLSTDVYFQQAGSLCVAHNKDLPELKRFQANLNYHLPTHKSALLSSHELQQLEPELSAMFVQGLFFAEEAQISPLEIMSALQTHLLQQEVIWYENTIVTNIQPHHLTTSTIQNTKSSDAAIPLSRYPGRGVRGEGQEAQHSFDWVIDTRGLGAKKDLTELRGVRGELIWLHAPDVNLTRPIRLLHPRYPIYVVPRPGNIYIVGATQIESEDFSPISVQSTLELLSAIYSLHKGFVEARIIKTLTQCRPAFADNMPQIKIQKGLAQINGLFRHGYLLAPALVDEVITQL